VLSNKSTTTDLSLAITINKARIKGGRNGERKGGEKCGDSRERRGELVISNSDGEEKDQTDKCFVVQKCGGGECDRNTKEGLAQFDRRRFWQDDIKKGAL